MKFKKLMTTLTIGSFVVASISGGLMFFEIAPGSVRATHEWMGVLFLIAGLLHGISHYKGIIRYFKSGYVFAIAGMICVGGFLYTSSINDIYSTGATFDMVIESRIDDLAPVFQQDPNQFRRTIQSLGFTVDRTDISLNEIAKSNNVEIYDVIEPLMAIRSR